MATATLETEAAAQSLNDSEFIAELQKIRRTDNVTNWWYMARTYLYLAAVLGGTLWFYSYQQAMDLSFWWNVPVTLLAIVLVGAGQHQLSGLAHEGVHHILFRNKYLNDLSSDLLCMFPIFSSTYHYRLQHLAHHQFVNDPERDPDVSQLKRSGHWFTFPLARRLFIRSMLKQFWVPNLFRFMRVRAVYGATGTDKSPYLRKGVKLSKVAVRIGLLYVLAQVASLTILYLLGNWFLLAVIPGCLWAAALVTFALMPRRFFHQSRVKPVVPLKEMSLLRITFITAMFNALAWLTVWTGWPAALIFLLLWVVPLFTSFSLFMILRQIVQHGNGGRGKLTNTRIFFVHPFIRFAVFPMGQDYHLPHHMYSSVPHYKLKALHELLLRYPEYKEEAVVVEGYFRPHSNPPKSPTVLDVLERDDTKVSDVFIDEAVMEAGDFEDVEAIREEGRLSASQIE